MGLLNWVFISYKGLVWFETNLLIWVFASTQWQLEQVEHVIMGLLVAERGLEVSPMCL